MRVFLFTMLLLSGLALAGCQQPGTYPVSGEECGPNDPVLDLDAADCTVPGGM